MSDENDSFDRLESVERKRGKRRMLSQIQSSFTRVVFRRIYVHLREGKNTDPGQENLSTKSFYPSLSTRLVRS